MPTFPKATVGLQDGNLGIAASQTDGIVCVIGHSTLAVAGTLYDFNNASPAEVIAAVGVGKGAELVASLCATEDHGPIILVGTTASTAGANSAVTSAGTSPPVVTLTGVPTDDASGIVQIVQAGARGTATFKYSLDGGVTYSPEIVTAATYLMPNGVTLNFATGTNYAVDNKYTFTCTAPGLTNTNITDALDALIASGRDVGVVSVVNANAGATDADRATAMAATFAVIKTKLSSLATLYRYTVAVMEAPSPVATSAAGLATWRAALIAAAPALEEKRTLIAAGYCTKVSDLDGLSYRRSAIFPVTERLSQSPISEDLGRLLSGAIRVSGIEHDEEASTALDTFRYTTLRRVSGREGFYVTQGNTFAASGSDYGLSQLVRVINTASKTARNKALDYLNDTRFADATTGKIREADALVMDGDITDALEAALVGHVSGVTGRIGRNSDIRNKQIKIEVRVQPLFYMKEIVLTLGYTSTLVATAA